MISVLAVLLASVALVNGQPAMPNMGAGFPGMPQAMGQPMMPQGMGQQAQPAQQTSTNAMNVGPSVFSNEQIAAVQQDYARRVGMDSHTAQQLDAQLMAQIANQRAPAAGAAGAQQGFRAMQMNVNQPLNGFGAARQAAQPVAQTFTNQQMVGNPLTQNPLGQNPLGQNPLGQNPLGQNPLGQNPLGQNPLGQYPGAAAADNNMMMGVDRNFLQQLMNQPQMQQYQRSLTDMGYGTGAANQPMMQAQQMAAPYQTQQMAAPYQTQQMASPYSIQQMATPYSIQQMNNPGMGNFPMDNYMNNQYNVQPTQQSVNDASTGFSNLLSGIGAGMTQGGQPINIGNATTI